MQIISFINMKGGVGKTTLTVNIAHALAQIHCKQVLLVDADPQFNATQYLMEDDAYLAHIDDPAKCTLRDIFVPKRPAPINTVTGQSGTKDNRRMPLSACTTPIFDGGSGRGKLDLIPSTLDLMEVETSKRGTEMKLKAYLDEKARGYDYVLIDCPPTISIFSQAAVLASHKYLVPIKPDPLSVVGLPLLEHWLGELSNDAGASLESVGLVFSMVRGPIPNRMGELMQDLRARRGSEVFTEHLSQSVDVSSSVEDHQPVFRWRPYTKTANQILNITTEFLART